MYRCEMILAVRVIVQCRDIQNLSFITAHLEYRGKTSRSIAKRSWLLWTDKKSHSSLPYRDRNVAFWTWGNENKNWKIICTVTFSLLVFASSRRKKQNDCFSFFFFKEKAGKMKGFSKYNKHSKSNVFTRPLKLTTYSVFTFLPGLGYHFNVFHCCLEHFLCHNSWNIHLRNSFKIKNWIVLVFCFFPQNLLQTTIKCINLFICPHSNHEMNH